MLVVLVIGAAVALGCFALGFGIFVLDSAASRPARAPRAVDAESLEVPG